MKVLLDTSVVVAGLLSAHPRHEACRTWLVAAGQRRHDVHVAATSVTEAFAVLTGLPLRPRISPALAWRMLERLLAAGIEVVALTAPAHVAAVKDAASIGLSGGVVHDAVIARAARVARVDRLLTLNVRDFRRAWPEAEERIAEP